jgi:hypothetical protein
MRMTLVLTAAALFAACVGSSSLVPVGLVSSDPAISAFVVPAKPGDVVCGPVHQGNGDANLIADAEKAGTVGCTEAFNVLADYLKQAPAKAQGTLRQLTINGWDCSSVDGTIGCGKQGLRFHTELLKK